MKLPLPRRKKKEERTDIKSRLERVKTGADDSCENREVSNLVKGLAEGDG